MYEKFRIAVFATNERQAYSGGRYASLMLAESLVDAGHEVSYVTNNVPAFRDDFKSIPSHKDISFFITGDFQSSLPEGEFDFVVLVPYLPLRNKDNTAFFRRTRQFAKSRDAALVLLSFETPNWFNETSPEQRDVSLWDEWQECCSDGCLVLSLSRTGMSYAKDFYRRYPDRTYFDFFYPPVNDATADMITGILPVKRITIITRFGNPHKGAEDIPQLFCRQMLGHTVSVILGKDNMQERIVSEIMNAARNVGAGVEFRLRLTDEEKYREIKSSCLMLFPSYFEGYGYPPVEALYCGTPCIAYDLPVIREITSGLTHVVPLGDIDTFRQKIADVLSKGDAGRNRNANEISKQFRIHSCGMRLDSILHDYHEKIKAKESCLKEATTAPSNALRGGV